MNTGWAVLIGALAIAAAAAISGRYQIIGPVGEPAHNTIWRVDTWTGKTWHCTASPDVSISGGSICFEVWRTNGR
jgi:hypothetical protein